MPEWNEETRKRLETGVEEWVSFEIKAVADIAAALSEIEKQRKEIEARDRLLEMYRAFFADFPCPVHGECIPHVREFLKEPVRGMEIQAPPGPDAHLLAGTEKLRAESSDPDRELRARHHPKCDRLTTRDGWEADCTCKEVAGG